jgi:excinuclease ABC subunit C
MSQLKDKLQEVPQRPGVYKFLSNEGVVLYVGKAKNLRSRLSQYFNNHDHRLQLPFLMAEATDFEYIVVRTELESLFLENTLIKEYLPPYNIQLRDDKSYAFIEIDYSQEIPQLSYARKTIKDKNKKYFGPYTSVKKIIHTLDVARKIFQFCSNKQVGKRPCFYYFLHRCPGVCIGQVSLSEYKKHFQKIELFLSGQTKPIKKQLELDMAKAAKQKKFELAARTRDQFQALSSLEEKQITIFTQNVSWDFVSVYLDELNACVNLFKVREGKLRDNENFIFQNTIAIAKDSRPAEVIQKFLENYYTDTTDLPKEIFLQHSPSSEAVIKQLLKSRTKSNIKISVPAIGDKQKLISMGITNAQQCLIKWQQSQATNIDNMNQILAELQELLKLPGRPSRIECYDISNTQGTNPVASMVVFKDGLPLKSEYRKFKITTKQTPDDFAMMREALTRRLMRTELYIERHPEQDEGSTKRSPVPEEDTLEKTKIGAWPTPDLLVIDGGKGQLGVAVEVLQELNLKIPVIGLAKRIEEIFRPHNSVPIVLDHSNPVLQLLQRLRDEAHRFGITFHRNLRSKQAVKSALDTIPGIGPATKKLLKQKIGTVANIKKASLEELTNLIGKSKAEILKRSL